MSRKEQGKEASGEGPPWDEDHPARKFLLDEIKAGGITKDMKPKQVYDKYKDVATCFKIKGMEDRKKFGSRLRGLYKVIENAKKAEAADTGPPWDDNHPARQFLFDEIAAGRIPASMAPLEVYNKYKDVARCFEIKRMDDINLLGSHLKGLYKIVARDKSREEEDREAFIIAFQKHPAPTHNHRGEPQWNGSAAQALLAEDMKNGLHLKMTPAQLHQMRDEYKEIKKLSVFRDHIHQNLWTAKYMHTLKVKADLKLKKTPNHFGEDED